MWKIDIDHRPDASLNRAVSPYYNPHQELIYAFRIEDKDFRPLFTGHCAQFMNPSPLWDFGLHYGGDRILYQCSTGEWMPYTGKREAPDL